MIRSVGESQPANWLCPVPAYGCALLQVACLPGGPGQPKSTALLDVAFGRFLVQFSLHRVHGKVYVVPGGFVLTDESLLSCAIVRRKMAALDFRRTVLALRDRNQVTLLGAKKVIQKLQTLFGFLLDPAGCSSERRGVRGAGCRTG